MEKIEKQIENEIQNIVFKQCFSRGNFKMGRSILYKFYLKYYRAISNIEVKRLILYNLMWVEINCFKNLNIAKQYSEQLKADMDLIEGYKEEQTDKYFSMLTCYLDSHKGELSKEELIEIYEFGSNYYNSIGKHLEELNFKFNLYLIKKNFIGVLSVIKDIHNNDLDIQYKILLDQMIEEIKSTNYNIYKQALKIIENTSKLCV